MTNFSHVDGFVVLAFQLRSPVMFVDREIFASKIISIKNFHGIFFTVHSIRKIFLTVNRAFISEGVDVCAETYLLIIMFLFAC